MWNMWRIWWKISGESVEDILNNVVEDVETRKTWNMWRIWWKNPKISEKYGRYCGEDGETSGIYRNGLVKKKGI